ncbi:AAA family ATPase [Paenibacillus sp. HB172176]|uniref:AAA family ATPase n=1 Tax=Paenibacillus sp. HB172176 TaxID=2493690 RepID=UPI00143C3C26|nr:AAA family ATPase [Paenibacillus sp. HB172176]
MAQRKIGLTLGKFAPLHKGHQLLIETALEEMDEVIVVIYDSPEVTNIPLNVRAGWIRRLYPEAEVIEGWDGPSDAGHSIEVQRIQERYILGLLGGRSITHFYSSEFYGEHMSKALHAVNRQVDGDRLKRPVSGTMIREDAYGNRRFVDNIVYRDLIVSAVFLGAPSTGKSTLAAHLAKRHETAWMPEYGREYWERHQQNRRLTLVQLEEIAEGHLLREEQLLQQAKEVLFVDTNVLTTNRFAHYYHGKSTEKLEAMAAKSQARYDLIFVCDTDIPYADTWDRSGAAQRELFQKQIVADLQVRKLPYILLRGTLEERAEKVERVLKGFRKFQSMGEWRDGWSSED